MSGINGTYSGNDTGTNVDRTAIQWLRLQIDPVGSSLSYYNHGRIYNSTASNPWYYYFPSVMANCAGDIALGFSGSSATNYIGAFYNWRPFSGGSNGPSRLIKAGQDYYELSNFGDYSATCLDPTDSLTFWTVQAFANVNTIGWRTWIANIARH